MIIINLRSELCVKSDGGNGTIFITTRMNINNVGERQLNIACTICLSVPHYEVEGVCVFVCVYSRAALPPHLQAEDLEPVCLCLGEPEGGEPAWMANSKASVWQAPTLTLQLNSDSVCWDRPKQMVLEKPLRCKEIVFSRKFHKKT